MKKSLVALLLLGSALMVSACGKGSSTAGSSALSSGTGDSSATQSETSSNEGSGSSTGETSNTGSSSSKEQGVDLADDWKGIVRLYIHTDAGVYSSYHLWIWGAGVNGYQVDFTNASSPDEYGVYYDVKLSDSPWSSRKSISSLSFLVKTGAVGEWSWQTTDTDIVFDEYSYNLDKDENGTPRITAYCVITDTKEIATYNKRSDALGDRIGSAVFTDWKTLVVKGTGASDGRAEADIGKIASWSLYSFTSEYWNMSVARRAEHKAEFLLKSGTGGTNSLTITFDSDIVPANGYAVEATFVSDTSKTKTGYASYISLYDTAKFQSDFTYSGEDLGLTWTADGKQVYKVWAPTASLVYLYRYSGGTPASLSTDSTAHPEYDYPATTRMTIGEKGVWSATVTGNYHFYNLGVIQNGILSTVSDPYVKSSGINGVRSAILTDAEIAATDPEGFRDSISALATTNPVKSPNQLSVYEVHVRDFTSDSSWVSNKGNKNGTYLAFAESGTTNNGVSSGLDSLVGLHPDAVQLLPVFDQDNDERTYDSTVNDVTTHHTPAYNWGYNPENYNVWSRAPIRAIPIARPPR